MDVSIVCGPMKNVIAGIEAFLFDMDGTLVTSIAAVDKVWTAWALRVGLTPSSVLAVIHGRPARASIQELTPHLNLAVEEAWVLEQELNESEGVEAIAGVHNFLNTLKGFPWAIVTSADTALALHRLKLAQIPLPQVLVTINRVKQGKPHPECFELAARELGVRPQNCLVVEDTNAGLLAGKKAGMQLLGIATTFESSQLISTECIENYHQLEFDQLSKELKIK